MWENNRLQESEAILKSLKEPGNILNLSKRENLRIWDILKESEGIWEDLKESKRIWENLREHEKIWEKLKIR